MLSEGTWKSRMNSFTETQHFQYVTLAFNRVLSPLVESVATCHTWFLPFRVLVTEVPTETWNTCRAMGFIQGSSSSWSPLLRFHALWQCSSECTCTSLWMWGWASACSADYIVVNTSMYQQWLVWGPSCVFGFSIPAFHVSHWFRKKKAGSQLCCHILQWYCWPGLL